MQYIWYDSWLLFALLCALQCCHCTSLLISQSECSSAASTGTASVCHISATLLLSMPCSLPKHQVHWLQWYWATLPSSAVQPSPGKAWHYLVSHFCIELHQQNCVEYRGDAVMCVATPSQHLIQFDENDSLGLAFVGFIITMHSPVQSLGNYG